MPHTNPQKIPLIQGFWSESTGDAASLRLIGNKCKACGEIFFPPRRRPWCIHCQQGALEEVSLGPRGKIATFSIVMQAPGGGFYKGTVPYAYGCVDLPEGVRVKALFAGADFDRLTVGQEVELVIDPLYQDDNGQDVVTFKFKPIEGQGGKP